MTKRDPEVQRLVDESAIRRCLEVAPEFRFPNVAALAEALVVDRDDAASVLANVHRAQREVERAADVLALQATESGASVRRLTLTS